MNGVKFVRQNGGLGRTSPGSDHISGLIVYGEGDIEKKLLLSKNDLDILGITAESNPVFHYHVSEFFRVNEGAKLYAQSVTTSNGNYDEVKTLQNFAEGSLRQVAVCDFKLASNNVVNSIAKLNQISKDLDSTNAPLSVLLSFKATTADMSTLPNLHTLNAERVSVVLGQDGGGRGAYLAKTIPAISCIGAALGAVSKAKVSESIGWVEKQNLVSTAYEKSLTGGDNTARELDVIGFCDGSLIKNYTPQQVQSINDKGYIFCVKYPGNTGTYFNDSFTATNLESDFAYIENNRTIDKAIREVYKVLTPKISGPAYVDPETGELDVSTLVALETLCEDTLDQMVRDGEISGRSVVIDPSQQILKTSKLEVMVKIVPIGTMREIIVKIGLNLSK